MESKDLDRNAPMKILLSVLCLLLLTSCGPSQEELRQAEMEQQRLEREASEQLAQEKATRTGGQVVASSNLAVPTNQLVATACV